MSTNCIHCVVNDRTGFDLLCDTCRAAEPLRLALANQQAACRELVKYDDDAEPIAEDDGRPYGLHSAQVNEDFAALFKAMLDATRKVEELKK